MKEQLVTFEVAKLAKEKGFNELSDSCYNIIGVISNNINNKNQDWTDNEVYTAPTQSLLQKWLRDVHKIDVNVIPVRYTGHPDIAYYTFAVMSVTPMKEYKYNTWEEALENALEKGLEEIK